MRVRSILAWLLLVLLILFGQSTAGITAHFACEHAGLTVTDLPCLTPLVVPFLIPSLIGIGVGVLLMGAGRRERLLRVSVVAIPALLALDVGGAFLAWRYDGIDAIGTPRTAGTPLFVEEFEDATRPRLEVRATAAQTLAYAQGGYQVRGSGGARTAPFVALPGRYAHTTMTVEARLVGPSENRAIVLGCRHPLSNAVDGYRLVVAPALRQYSVLQWDDGRATPLLEPQISSAIRSDDESNRLSLTCAGARISVTINDVPVADVSLSEAGDVALFSGGRLSIGVNAADEAEVEARFDRLSVTQAPT